MKALYLLALTILVFSSCSISPAERVPHDRAYPFNAGDYGFSANGSPLLKVYVEHENLVQEMDVETYLAGVVAGEMKNDWPLEALKAQAILARTFVMKFVTEKESMYPGADISTDVREAQAYNAGAVNDRIRRAVAETAGMVLITQDGSLPYTWFHAHSGGSTALAQEALGWNKAEPSYTKVTDGLDSPAAPDSAAAWTAVFAEDDFLAACRRAGAPVNTLHSLSVKEKGQSGRAVTLAVNNIEVNAARLRIELGSTVMRSTLLTELYLEDQQVVMAGKGYGHGVGMPQWGAYALAQDGWSGEEIALHYYNDLRLARLQEVTEAPPWFPDASGQ